MDAVLPSFSNKMLRGVHQHAILLVSGATNPPPHRSPQMTVTLLPVATPAQIAATVRLQAATRTLANAEAAWLALGTDEAWDAKDAALEALCKAEVHAKYGPQSLTKYGTGNR